MPPEQTMPPQHEGDNDTTRRELAEMDRFLDGHPEVAEQLRKDPSLINNQEFVEKHPELREFLQNHPGVREEFRENPNASCDGKIATNGTRAMIVIVTETAIVEMATQTAETWQVWTGSWTAIRRSPNSSVKIPR